MYRDRGAQLVKKPAGTDVAQKKRAPSCEGARGWFCRKRYLSFGSIQT